MNDIYFQTIVVQPPPPCAQCSTSVLPPTGAATRSSLPPSQPLIGLHSNAHWPRSHKHCLWSILWIFLSPLCVLIIYANTQRNKTDYMASFVVYNAANFMDFNGMISWVLIHYVARFLCYVYFEPPTSKHSLWASLTFYPAYMYTNGYLFYLHFVVCVCDQRNIVYAYQSKILTKSFGIIILLILESLCQQRHPTQYAMWVMD